LQTNEIPEINNFIPQNDIFKDSEIVLDPALPIYHKDKGSYIWYKNSIPADVLYGKLSEGYDVLYQSVKPAEYKPQLKMYVSAYTACLTAVILIMLSFVLIPDAFASLYAGKPAVMYQHMPQHETTGHIQSEVNDNINRTEGFGTSSPGFSDHINNVIYVNLPNGMISIQESSWNTEEKAENRAAWINSLGYMYSDGTRVESVIIKADLNQRGVWYRTMIGEFVSIEDAVGITEQIRAAQ